MISDSHGSIQDRPDRAAGLRHAVLTLDLQISPVFLKAPTRTAQAKEIEHIGRMDLGRHRK